MSKKEKDKQEVDPQNNPAAETQGSQAGETTDKASPGDSKNQSTEETTAEQEIVTSEEQITRLEKQLAEATDKYLRLFSEFDNFRKRSIKERIELTSTASAGVITSLLPVLDDLERASRLLGESQDKDAAMEGIQLIYNKFKTILLQKGVEEIKTMGETFNTDYHDAITHIPSTEEQQKGKIVDEVQKGYMLNGKVIRFARVVVAN